MQSPDGCTVTSAAADETLKFWNVSQQRDKAKRQSELNFTFFFLFCFVFVFVWRKIVIKFYFFAECAKIVTYILGLVLCVKLVTYILGIMCKVLITLNSRKLCILLIFLSENFCLNLCPPFFFVFVFFFFQSLLIVCILACNNFFSFKIFYEWEKFISKAHTAETHTMKKKIKYPE